MNQRQRDDLDRHITGNYGEDQLQPKKRRKRLSGPAAMKKAGYVPVLIRLTQNQRAAIETARLLDGRNLSNFIGHYATEAAMRIAGAASQ